MGNFRTLSIGMFAAMAYLLAQGCYQEPEGWAEHTHESEHEHEGNDEHHACWSDPMHYETMTDDNGYVAVNLVNTIDHHNPPFFAVWIYDPGLRQWWVDTNAELYLELVEDDKGILHIYTENRSFRVRVAVWYCLTDDELAES